MQLVQVQGGPGRDTSAEWWPLRGTAIHHQSPQNLMLEKVNLLSKFR